MTPAELRRICDSLNDARGTGGQTRLAELLGWDGSTVRRKLSGAVRNTKADAMAVWHAVECGEGRGTAESG